MDIKNKAEKEGSQPEDGAQDVYVGSTEIRVRVYCDMTKDGGGWLVGIITRLNERSQGK